MAGWIIVVVILAAAVYLVVTYNNLVSNRGLTLEGWSGIDVQLKRRADLIPSLVGTVKGDMGGDMGHERDALEAVTNARAAAQAGAKASPERRAQLEGQLSGALGKLVAVAEAHPDLMASTIFLDQQSALQKVEEELQLSCRYYNDTARNLNIAVQSFPSSIIASLFRFSTAQYFELDNPADRGGAAISRAAPRPRAHRHGRSRH